MRRRREGEDWATFGEELRLITHPDPNACEQIALNHQLTSITNLQVVLSVRQQKPTTASPKMSTVAQVGAACGCEIDESDGLQVAEVTKDAMLKLLQKLTDRWDKLESKLDVGAESSRLCWSC